MQALRRMIKRLDESPPHASFALVVLAAIGVFAATASWGETPGPDAAASALSAWQFATNGNLDVSQLGDNLWFVERGGRLVSNRPPGATLIAIPAYLVWQFAEPSFVPSTATAVATTALALGFLHLALRKLLKPSTAAAAVAIFGLGTATWPISSDQLWQHGPAQMWLALAVLAMSSSSQLPAGMAFGLAILTRPITAVLAATAGIAEGWKTRSPRVTLAIGSASAVGFAGLLWFNRVMFETFSPLGTYDPEFAARLTSTPVGEYARNLLGAIADPLNGLLIWSPFIVVLLLGVPAGWRAAPSWVKSSALAGGLYLLLHARLNRFSGGLPVDYRYPLEALVVAAPLMALSYREWVSRSRGMKAAFMIGVAVAVVMQGLVAVAFDCQPVSLVSGQFLCSFF